MNRFVSHTLCTKVCANIRQIIFAFSHHLPMAGLKPSSSLSTGCVVSSCHGAIHRLCGVNEGRLSHFLPRWLRTGWRSMISLGKIPWNAPPRLGIEPRPRGGQTVRFILPLSYHDWRASISWNDWCRPTTIPGTPSIVLFNLLIL